MRGSAWAARTSEERNHHEAVARRFDSSRLRPDVAVRQGVANQAVKLSDHVKRQRQERIPAFAPLRVFCRGVRKIRGNVRSGFFEAKSDESVSSCSKLSSR